MNTIWFPDLTNTSVPKYQIIVDAIRSGISNGQLEEGEKLPPVREVAWHLGITPGTVARAFSQLVDAGVLEATVGRGTFVAKQRAVAQVQDWPEVVSLKSPKLPDVGQIEAVRSALRKISHMQDGLLMGYPNAKTDLPAREAVLEWSAGKLLGRTTPDDVVLTYGGQNAITLILQTVLKGAAPVVLAEDLTYAGFRHAARLQRAKIVGLASDEYGVRPGALDAACRAHDAQIFCTSPEVHNPTAHRTGLERRKALADVAQHHGVQILEDDCYALRDSDLPSYRALLPRQTWYVSSISKLLTPSLRLGYAIAPSPRAAELRRTAQYSFFGIATPLTELTAELLSSPNIADLNRAMQDQIAALVQVAVNGLGSYDLRWRPDVPFLWLSLPNGWRAGSFCSAAERAGVLIRSADDFTLMEDRAPHAVRIAVNGQVDIKCFEAAIGRLRGLLDKPPSEIEV
ncbi:aminotransferase-like domain-containing protein [Litoreibacter roseus]|uniref:GntR family transcriptional regulator n=1 Tax=Litoreibacter roseus TaxID=2601869 RepID=A0A6N6JEA5_9RHOB|nr:PLP-dependent aminotransferase family protein [Litoreibacter roseus]GFE63709.1 GntR family transcriptional regulator [Litoreibacter roseus]